MKNIILITLLSAFTLSAQPPAGGNMKMPEGKMYGKVVDNQGKPVEFATVVLLKATVDPATKVAKDLMFKGLTSSANGDFSFEGIPMMSKLKLKISSVGFKTLELPVAFEMPKMDKMPKPGEAPNPEMMAKFAAALNKDLGNIKLETESTELSAVTVTAQKALLEMDIDKKTFNVEKNIVSAGGTAVDIMRNIPSVQVDIDGNVKVRNAAPTIFIDGRPTTLSLDQIPADAIEKVEVITNPSAKYDASGSMAGILNIVLKKNKKSGINGMLNLGMDSNSGYNGMANLNIRQNKWSLTYMGMNMGIRNRVTGNSERVSDIGGVNASILQDIDNKTKGTMMFNRIGFDYNLTNRTSVSIGTVLGGGKFKPNETRLITNTTDGTTTLSQRLSETERQFTPRVLQLGLKHSFPTAGEELTMDFNLFGGTNGGTGLFTTNYLNNASQTVAQQIQKNVASGSNSFKTIQIDYTKPFKNGISIETGLRAQLNDVLNENENTLKAVGSDEFKNITSASANYDSKNSVYAGYFSMAGKVRKAFSYKVGLRGESSEYEGKLLNTNEVFTNKFPISLFPSVFLSKELTKKDNIQLSLTRRVNRPNFFQLIPFVDYTDSLNITRGNANLLPEFTTSGEFSYSKAVGTGTFLTSAYYKHSNNLITRYLNQEINPLTGQLDLINTYVNANSSVNYGVEFTYTNKIQKWWDFTSNVNFYNSRINLANIENAIQQDALWTAFGKLNNNFNLPKKWVIQLSFDYQGKTNMPVSQNQGYGPPMSQAQSSSQGYIEPFYGVDLALKKTFMKNDMGSFTLSVNDLFRTRGNTQVSSGEGFMQTYYRLNNPQLVKLNFSMRFGKMDMNMFKRNNNTGTSEAMQMQ